MGRDRIFTTLPSGAIADTSLTALDLRALAVIALHDGMSSVSGKGAGCYAKNATLAAEVRTDVTNFSKSLSRLVRAGYVAREPQLMDKRRFTLRVQYRPIESWRNDQQSCPDAGEIVGEPANNTSEIVGKATNETAEIVGDGESENGGFSSETDRHYISLNEELDSVETEELNSLKGRIQNSEEIDFPDGTQRPLSAASFGLSLDLKDRVAEAPSEKKISQSEAWQKAQSLRGILTDRFKQQSWAAQLVQFERAFAKIGRDPELLSDEERQEWADWLHSITDEVAGTSEGHQAERLHEEIARW